ncbi:protein RIC-3 isoform X1 [Pongo pygmaeus]|nr:protein RIC-3 isoform X1 [Pongo pygmaeus]XP_054380713.1 protein RIC-3 isoform X1 [Pongo abelii]
MAYSTVQRVALASGLVLALSLLLPKAFLSRGKRQEPPPTPEGKLGRFPPMMHHHQAPSDGQTPGAHFQRSHLAEAFAKAKGSGGGAGGGGSGRGLMGQIIPIYGFGIFLYILYILFKLSKGKTTAEDGKCYTATPGNTHRKITSFELAQLQEKLKETEAAMEKLINRVGPNGESIQTDHSDVYIHCLGVFTTKRLDCLIFLSRAQTVTSDQEKRLLHQLREITRVMKEGKFIDRFSPEKEAEEAPYMEDWEGYPEETYPIYDLSDCIKHRQETILVDYPDPKELSAEEIAERVGMIEEEESDHLGWESLPTDPRAQEDNSVTSCDPKPETCSCCFHEDEDPAVLAENAGFSADSYPEQEETTKEEWSQDFKDEGLGISTDKAYTGSMLRKRNLQGLE